MIKIFGYNLYSGYIINKNNILAYSLNYNKIDLIKQLNNIKKFHNLDGEIIFSEDYDKKFNEILNDKYKIKEFRKNIDLNLYKYNDVYRKLLKLDDNEIISYSDLKNRLKIKNIRSIILALKNNPFIIIIPCHRVIRKNGDIGDYTPLGKDFKRILIENKI